MRVKSCCITATKIWIWFIGFLCLRSAIKRSIKEASEDDDGGERDGFKDSDIDNTLNDLIVNKCEPLFNPKESSNYYYEGPALENSSINYKHV